MTTVKGGHDRRRSNTGDGNSSREQKVEGEQNSASQLPVLGGTDDD
jgi:hypothetical protein